MSHTDTPNDRLGVPAEVQAELLASRRRCLLLVALAEMGEAAVVDLAARVRAAERGVETDRVDRDERERVRQEIFECHLPRLTATGVVEYDSLLGKLRLAEPAIASRARRTLSSSRHGHEPRT